MTSKTGMRVTKENLKFLDEQRVQAPDAQAFIRELTQRVSKKGDELISKSTGSARAMYGHINMVGHYTFTLSDDTIRTGLRPLNFNINNELSPWCGFFHHLTSPPTTIALQNTDWLQAG
ncbi:hypothetical protein [Serratia fonticola]|uniref:Uncharacterized protein n=1 Tax=Serratia fonticola TaxID=47917 RepID=A0ABY9PRI2_SERFO|nr:hypothetical protein [Serratia fonticola]WMT16047.1 hypothetical protein RFB13_06885 [Serratia fonticola]